MLEELCELLHRKVGRGLRLRGRHVDDKGAAARLVDKRVAKEEAPVHDLGRVVALHDLPPLLRHGHALLQARHESEKV